MDDDDATSPMGEKALQPFSQCPVKRRRLPSLCLLAVSFGLVLSSEKSGGEMDKESYLNGITFVVLGKQTFLHNRHTAVGLL